MATTCSRVGIVEPRPRESAKGAKLALDQPASYEIKVLGILGESWSDWIEGMTLTVDRETVDREGDDRPITTLTGTLDQAALQGVLRRLYALGLPLISVQCIEGD